MVDILALAVSHALLALAAWRLLWRPELDVEGGAEKSRRIVRRGMQWGGADDRAGSPDSSGTQEAPGDD